MPVGDVGEVDQKTLGDLGGLHAVCCSAPWKQTEGCSENEELFLSAEIHCVSTTLGNSKLCVIVKEYGKINLISTIFHLDLIGNFFCL